uniref:Methionine aminopeptidase n=1 Tax=uncultured Nitrospirae bacterium Rifle_16ft_4_minimus_39958 TaxID=1665131 RepID=A0A0H4T8H2_9BACT|nr:methionine aminopeptidase, methionyl aminopeptidase [uncultured Nitrospirae bacterium Rifle_16ft_4_minimus_39958]
MIIIKSRKEIEKIRASCIIVTGALEELKQKVRSGITTRELDRIAEEFILKNGGVPAFKGYKGYPSASCISVNEEIVHGIPSYRDLKDGDIVSIDIGVLLDGYYGDAAITVPVNEIDSESRRLLDVTEKSLYKALDFARPGCRVSDISCTIQDYVESAGYSVVREFVGHGIGSSLHEDPPVPNYGERGKGPRLKAGMVLAIEPMVNAGGSDLVVLDNGWTAVTKDRKRSAHFEHTVAITEDGHEILSML